MVYIMGMALQIERVDVLRDNYIWLLREPQSGAVGCVDPAEAGPVAARLDALGWKLTHILNTHHHGDHTGGNLELKRATGCTIVGPAADRARIPGIDVALADGDTYAFGAETAKVFDVSGHTRGHIAFWFEAAKAAFVGDTLFSLGCGRLFEGTPAQMWFSLSKLRRLPPETLIYCAHEYTQSNARFALTIEPDNKALLARVAEIDELRRNHKSTVPSTLASELAANPFLRAADPGVARAVGLPPGNPVAVFAEIRARKDKF